jgi:WD40 repeat protein
MMIEAPPRPPQRPPETPPQDPEALIEEARRRARRRRLLLAASVIVLALVGTSVGLAISSVTRGSSTRTGPGPAVTYTPSLGGKLLLLQFAGLGHKARSAIESIRPDGTGLRPLARGGGLGWSNENVALSPDGNRVAFIRDRGNGLAHSAVFGLNLRTHHAERVTPWSARVGDPRWALGGRRIVYDRFRRDLSGAIWSIRPDGTDARNLTGTMETYHSFVMSPNGRWIAYTAALPGEFAVGNGRLYAERVDGSDRRVLASGAVSVPGSWSARGLILFTRYPTNQSPSGTTEAVSLSRHVRRYTGVPTPEEPTWLIWSPEGDRFAAAAGHRVLVANESGRAHSVNRNSRRYAALGAWSPDGKHIAYTESWPGGLIERSPVHAAVVIVNATSGHVDSAIPLRRRAVVVGWTRH